MRVVFADEQLADVCSARRRLVARWGVAAHSVELALCSLRAGLTLNTFLALPNVTKENDAVIFTTTTAAVHLLLAELHIADGVPAVVVSQIDALDQELS